MAEGEWDGNWFEYLESETTSGLEREISLAKAGGDIVRLDNAKINHVLDGDIDTILDVIGNDLAADLDFDIRWSEDDADYLSVDIPDRLLTASIDDHFLQLQLTSDGYLQYDSADDDLHLKLGAPNDGKIPVYTAQYSDDFLSVNLDDTLLALDRDAGVAGLYTDTNYLAKAVLEDESVITEGASDAWEAIKGGDFGEEECNNLIRSTLQEVQINSRELSKGYLTFQESKWNELLRSLAWDVGEFSLSDETIIQVIEAEESTEQMYVVLEALLPASSPSAALAERERSLWYELGFSILDSSSTQQPASLGIAGFHAPASVSFSSFYAPTALKETGLGVGAEVGYLNADLPLFGKHARTSLGASTLAERYYVYWGENVMEQSGFTASLDGLLYAYRFPDDASLDLHDAYQRPFSASGSHRSLVDYLYENDQDRDALGLVVPGALFGGTIRSTHDMWYAKARVMPYLPAKFDPEDFSLTLEDLESAGDLTNFYETLSYATDLRGGFKLPFWGHEVQLDLGRDVNGFLSVAPQIRLADRFTFGIETDGPTLRDPHYLKYHVGAKLFGLDSRFFMEENPVSETQVYGASIDKEIKGHRYNLSAGLASWDNAGTQEVVERYLSVGADLNSKTYLTGSILCDDILKTQRYLFGSQFRLDEKGEQFLSLEGGLRTGAAEDEVEVTLQTHIIF